MARAQLVVGAVLAVVGVAFMGLAVYLALASRVYASLLAAASGATVLLVGADLMKE